MATKWFYRVDNGERGPVGFHDLVVLVKDNVLCGDDLVRPEYQRQWQSADTVPCLFEMALQTPREQLRVSSASKSIVDRDSEGEQLVEMADVCDDADLQRWFNEQLASISVGGTAGVVREPRSTDSPSVRCSGSDGLIASTRRAHWHSTVGAAVKRADAHRRRSCEFGASLAKGLARFASGIVLKQVYRWTITVLAAILTASAIFSWSEAEIRRYPDPHGPIAMKYVFPMWGKCSTEEFLLLVLDTTVIAGIVGYGGARVLELTTEE